MTDSKHIATTFTHSFADEGDPKPREKDHLSREERALTPCRARKREVGAETEGQKEKVEDEESDLATDQHLSADGATHVVQHNADSKPQALQVGGIAIPPKKERRPLKYLTPPYRGTTARRAYGDAEEVHPSQGKQRGKKLSG